jgi:hypothetical protein
MLSDIITTVRRFYSYYPRAWKTRDQLAAFLAMELATEDRENDTIIDYLIDHALLSAVMSCKVDRSLEADELDLDMRLLAGPLLYEDERTMTVG